LSPTSFLASGDLLGIGLLEIDGITGGAISGLGLGDAVTSGFLPPQAPNTIAILPMSKIRILIDPVLRCVDVGVYSFNTVQGNGKTDRVICELYLGTAALNRLGMAASTDYPALINVASAVATAQS
jgi:hypothetical protein